MRRRSRRAPFGALVIVLLASLGTMTASASARPMYVTSETSAVPVVDLANGTVSATIEGVGEGSVAIAISPDGGRAYLASFESNAVSVVDTATNAVIATIPLTPGSDPTGIAITPDGRQVYVAESVADQVVVIDTATDTVSKTISLAPGSGPRPIAISPDGRRAYVGEIEVGEVAVIDTATDAVSKTISLAPVISQPIGLAIAPDGRRLYAVGLGAEEVAVIDTATETVSSTVQLPPGLGGFDIAISPDGRRAYVPEAGANEVTVIDTATDTVSKTIPLGSPGGLLFDIAISPDGRRAYVTRLGTDEIAVLDTMNDEVLAPIEVAGARTIALAIPPDQPPTAALAPAAGVPGSPVAFDASASADPDGGSLTYDWDFGDGAVALDAGPTPSHAYAAPGAYHATVTVDDGEGCTGFVFTGQTAYCNGPSTASAATEVRVAPLPSAPEAVSRPAPAFLLRKLTGNPANGSVRVRLWLSGAGTLRLRGADVRSIRRTVAEARTLTVVVRPTRKAMKALNGHRRLRVRIGIAFRPAAGAARTVSKTLTLRRQART